jgi:hypothetical protein
VADVRVEQVRGRAREGEDLRDARERAEDLRDRAEVLALEAAGRARGERDRVRVPAEERERAGVEVREALAREVGESGVVGGGARPGEAPAHGLARAEDLGGRALEERGRRQVRVRALAHDAAGRGRPEERAPDDVRVERADEGLDARERQARLDELGAEARHDGDRVRRARGAVHEPVEEARDRGISHGGARVHPASGCARHAFAPGPCRGLHPALPRTEGPAVGGEGRRRQQNGAWG